jgi:Flp pilus assembly protein TadD
LSSRRTLAAVAVVLAALVSASPTSADAPRSAWARGIALFKQTRYDEACSLLAQAAAQTPTNGAIWGDLGLCEFKRGNTAASIHASLLAVRHGDERVRKSAYFNLYLAGD